MKRIAIFSILCLFFIPVNKNDKTLDNYGIKNRSIAPTLIGNTVSNIPITREIGYDKLRTLIPYIKTASRQFQIPENVLAAVLYEEILHRKPVDVKTFGVAQLGVQELVKQGLPPKQELLDDDEVSVWVLARKLRRLQDETGSLRTAITLHNGYYDYYESVKKSAKDPRILSLLQQRNQRQTIFA